VIGSNVDAPTSHNADGTVGVRTCHRLVHAAPGINDVTGIAVVTV
jgi:hypothetical protein